jgi:hypothetical protein
VTAVVQYVILGATTMSVLAFALYVVAMAKLPADERPKVPILDRFGRQIGMFENPGFAETEDEHE